jgi:hypothetical protein
MLTTGTLVGEDHHQVRHVFALDAHAPLGSDMFQRAGIAAAGRDIEAR